MSREQQQHSSLPARLLWFVALWLAAAGFNMWVGVAKAGYSVGDELPVFLLLFGVPAAAPDSSLKFLLVGASILIPLILAYTAWSYWVFRGKVDPSAGYH